MVYMVHQNIFVGKTVSKEILGEIKIASQRMHNNKVIESFSQIGLRMKGVSGSQNYQYFLCPRLMRQRHKFYVQYKNMIWRIKL